VCLTIILLTILECAEDDSKSIVKREAKDAERQREKSFEQKNSEGGVLAVDRSDTIKVNDSQLKLRDAFQKLWHENSPWMKSVISDSIALSVEDTPQQEKMRDMKVASMFSTSIWPSLKTNGWSSKQVKDERGRVETHYMFQGKAVGLRA
jgi:hypothetical protein